MLTSHKWHAIECNQEAEIFREFLRDCSEFASAIWLASYENYKTLKQLRLERYVAIGGDPAIDDRPQFVKDWLSKAAAQEAESEVAATSAPSYSSVPERQIVAADQG